MKNHTAAENLGWKGSLEVSLANLLLQSGQALKSDQLS